MQCFNELLVQCPIPGQDPDNPFQIGPDNMVVNYPEPIKAESSYMTPKSALAAAETQLSAAEAELPSGAPVAAGTGGGTETPER